MGNWGETGGLILTNWQVHDFQVHEHLFDAMAMGVDWGFNHYTVILLCGIKDGELYICKELAVREETQETIVQMAKEMNFPRHLYMWCDSASPELVKALRLAGFRARSVEKEPRSVNAQIQWLKDRKIHVHPSCIQTQKEIGMWKWIKDNKTGLYLDEPVQFEDDAMAAMRYAIEPWRKKRRYNTRTQLN